MFQFDTTFMYAITVLLIINLFQKRHPDITPDPSLAWGLIGLCVFFTVIHTYYTGLAFWLVFLFVDIFTCLFISAYFYLSGDIFRLFRNRPTAKEVFDRPSLFVFLSMLMIMQWALVMVAVAFEPDFASVLLGLLILHFLCYLGYYMGMKLRYDHGNRAVIWKPVLLFFITLILAGVALYFFLLPSSDKNQLPMISRNLNRDCVVMDFFDTHDVWHFFAAAGLFFASISLLYLDVDLAEVSADKIKSF
jgi:hypothetical protein